MNNLTLLQKQELEALCEQGMRVYTVAYNTATVTGTNPETEALAAGLREYYREESGTIREIIYYTLTEWDGGTTIWDGGATIFYS